MLFRKSCAAQNGNMNSFGKVRKALQQKQPRPLPEGHSSVRGTDICTGQSMQALEKLKKGQCGWMGSGRKDESKKGIQREGQRVRPKRGRGKTRQRVREGRERRRKLKEKKKGQI